MVRREWTAPIPNARCRAGSGCCWPRSWGRPRRALPPPARARCRARAATGSSTWRSSPSRHSQRSPPPPNRTANSAPRCSRSTSSLAVPACLALWVRRTAPDRRRLAGRGTVDVQQRGIAREPGRRSSRSRFTPARGGRCRSGAAVAATVVESAIFSAPSDCLAFELMLTIAAFAFGSFVRARRLLVLSLQEHSRQLQYEQQLRVHEAQLAERARIAREMHDVLAHRISLLSVHAGALEFNPDASPEEIAEAAGVIRDQRPRRAGGAARGDRRAACEPRDARPRSRRSRRFADLAQLVAESRAAGMDVTLTDALDGEALLADPRAHRLPSRPGGADQRAQARAWPGRGDRDRRRPGGRRAGRGREPPRRPGRRTRWPTSTARTRRRRASGLVGLAERVTLVGGRLEQRGAPRWRLPAGRDLPWSDRREHSVSGAP